MRRRGEGGGGGGGEEEGGGGEVKGGGEGGRERGGGEVGEEEEDFLKLYSGGSRLEFQPDTCFRDRCSLFSPTLRANALLGGPLTGQRQLPSKPLPIHPSPLTLPSPPYRLQS